MEIIICPASRGFSLVWRLAFTKSFAWLISRVVGLFYTPQLRDRRATRTTSLMLKTMQQRNLCSLGNHYDPEMLAMKVSVHVHIVTAIITMSKKQIKKRHIVA